MNYGYYSQGNIHTTELYCPKCDKKYSIKTAEFDGREVKMKKRMMIHHMMKTHNYEKKEAYEYVHYKVRNKRFLLKR